MTEFASSSRVSSVVCLAALLGALISSSACSRRQPTAEEAKAFLERAEAKLFTLSEEAGRAAWVQATYITGDTEMLAARANQRAIDGVVELVKESKRFDGMKLPAEMDRKMKLLKLSLTLAAPAEAKESEELTRTAARMEGAYGKGRACREGREGPVQVPRHQRGDPGDGGEPESRRTS